MSDIARFREEFKTLIDRLSTIYLRWKKARKANFAEEAQFEVNTFYPETTVLPPTPTHSELKHPPQQQSTGHDASSSKQPPIQKSRRLIGSSNIQQTPFMSSKQLSVTELSPTPTDSDLKQTPKEQITGSTAGSKQLPLENSNQLSRSYNIQQAPSVSSKLPITELVPPTPTDSELKQPPKETIPGSTASSKQQPLRQSNRRNQRSSNIQPGALSSVGSTQLPIPELQPSPTDSKPKEPPKERITESTSISKQLPLRQSNRLA